jgi:hypothetical protein
LQNTQRDEANGLARESFAAQFRPLERQQVVIDGRKPATREKGRAPRDEEKLATLLGHQPRQDPTLPTRTSEDATTELLHLHVPHVFQGGQPRGKLGRGPADDPPETRRDKAARREQLAQMHKASPGDDPTCVDTKGD